MDYKKEIQDLLSGLKREGISRRQIEIDLGYREKSIDQILSKGGNNSFLGVLRFYSKVKLNKPISDTVIAAGHNGSETVNYSKVEENLLALSALVVELLHLEIAQESAGSQEKAKKIRHGILQRIGPKLNSDLKKGIAAGGG